MANLRTGKHISRRFNDELDEIRHHLLEMGGIVEEQLAKATRAFQDSDRFLAEEVLQEGQRVNQLEQKVDEQSTHCLAKRQPAASDLRLILTVLKIVSDIERVGDQAERFARIAIKIIGFQSRINHVEVLSLAEKVRKMFYVALDAFARMDVESALSVIQEDEKVNQAYDEITRLQIQSMKQNRDIIDHSLDVLWAVRALERIGDHSCNICEYIIYLARGKDIRHQSFEEQTLEVLDKQER
jgi:phosphate transport system protein